MDNLVNKAKMLGIHIIKIDTLSAHPCYIINESDTNATMHIPDDVERISGGIGEMLRYNKKINHLKVVGGNSLKSTDEIFSGCRLETLDVSELNTSNVVSMEGMFFDCNISKIILGNFDVSKVKDMRTMFALSRISEIDFSLFNTNSIMDISNMFNGCIAKKIDLSNIDLSKVHYMRNMFRNCTADYIKLPAVINKEVKLSGIFINCTAQNIEVSTEFYNRLREMDKSMDVMHGCNSRFDIYNLEKH